MASLVIVLEISWRGIRHPCGGNREESIEKSEGERSTISLSCFLGTVFLGSWGTSRSSVLCCVELSGPVEITFSVPWFLVPSLVPGRQTEAASGLWRRPLKVNSIGSVSYLVEYSCFVFF